VPYYGDTSCAGPFYTNSVTGYTTDCRRASIARRAIFDVLDDNDDGTINSSDETSLNIRVGYMRFTNGDDTGGDYSSGNNKYTYAIGSKYSLIYCKNNTSCTVSSTCTDKCVDNTNEPGNSGTPLAASLNEAKLYLDANKAADTQAKDCRQKFVILVSDGADTYGCSGAGNESQADQYMRRRETVAKAKALADAGYKVFVVGFGSAMPDYLKNTLNWMAFLGETDNPNDANSGSTTAYDPSAVTSCGTSTTTGTCDGTSTDCFATSNDPGNTPLSGYAFLAADANAMATALKTAINIIREATYSFTQASVQSSRTADENFIYEASFEPISSDPFWRGHLKKYQINSDGTVGTMLIDAADVLFTTSASGRTVKTLLGSTLTDFTTAIDKAYFGVSTDAERDAIVGYFRGDATYNPEVSGTGIYKLGDVFRSTPITVGTPSAFFEDSRDQNHAFAAFRDAHCRASGCSSTADREKRLILAGANDGQMHAFKTMYMSEAWSFIPPNLLPKLVNITHTVHPTTLTHLYFVDGPVTVADVWWGSDGTHKTSTDWKTIFIFGEGRGSTPNLWSSSSYCDTGFNSVYDVANNYKYYCGYYAFNLTETLAPAFLWTLDGGGANAVALAPYLGDPWSKVMIGRVKYSGAEKWVGFIGAGYNASDCSGGGSCDTRGKGFYLVDLSNGQILWKYTHDNNADMDYSLAASAAVVDTDNDGFIDTAYIGDLGGSVWRFKFCTQAEGACTWSGGRFFASSTGTIRPIYTMPAVAKDGAGNLWVYWGTGDKTDPTASNAQEKFFGLKDNDRTTTYTISDLDNITSTGSTYDNTNSTKAGYYINLSGTGQKILADPTVFGGVVYFTTYDPGSGGNLCDQGGEASIFGIEYTSGAGVFSGGGRSMSLGSGIASAPIVSMGQGGTTIADLYVTVSGGGGASGSTFRLNFTPPGLANRTNILYWKDQRLQ
jgi:Tfp pilus tip-associated adhesin PilY1